MKMLKKCSIVGMALCMGVTVYACSNSQSTNAQTLNNLNNLQTTNITRLASSLDNVLSASNQISSTNDFRTLNLTPSTGRRYGNRTSVRFSTGMNQNGNLQANSGAGNLANLNSNTNSSQNSSSATYSNVGNSSSVGNSSNFAANSSNGSFGFSAGSLGTSNTNSFGQTNTLSGTNRTNQFAQMPISRQTLINQVQLLRSNAEDLRSMLSSQNYALNSLVNIEDCCKVFDLTSNNLNAYFTGNISYLGSNSNMTSSSRLNQNVNQTTSSNTANNLTEKLISSNIQVTNEAIDRIRASLTNSSQIALNGGFANGQNSTNSFANNTLSAGQMARQTSQRPVNPNARNNFSGNNYLEKMNNV